MSYHNGSASYAWRREDANMGARQTWTCSTLDGEWTTVERYTHWSLGDNWTVRNSVGDIRYMTEHARKAGEWTLVAEPVRR